LLNKKISGFNVTLCIDASDASDASLKYLEGNRLIKVNENHYVTQVMILRLWVTTGQCQHKQKLAYLVVMVDGSGLEPVQKKMLYRANKLPSCASTRETYVTNNVRN
jgi:hypothetical protein